VPGRGPALCCPQQAPPRVPRSERLASYFEEHAAEKALLQHDKPLAAAPTAAHLKHLPAYLKVRPPLRLAVHATHVAERQSSMGCCVAGTNRG
jgi:hypothetical protein